MIRSDMSVLLPSAGRPQTGAGVFLMRLRLGPPRWVAGLAGDVPVGWGQAGGVVLAGRLPGGPRVDPSCDRERRTRRACGVGPGVPGPDLSERLCAEPAGGRAGGELS